MDKLQLRVYDFRTGCLYVVARIFLLSKMVQLRVENSPHFRPHRRRAGKQTGLSAHGPEINVIKLFLSLPTLGRNKPECFSARSLPEWSTLQ